MKSIFSYLKLVVTLFMFLQLMTLIASSHLHSKSFHLNGPMMSSLNMQNQVISSRYLTEVKNISANIIDTSNADQIYVIDGELFILIFRNNNSNESDLYYNRTQIRFVYFQSINYPQSESIVLEGTWQLIAKDFNKNKASCLFLASMNSETFKFINIDQNQPSNFTSLSGSRMNFPSNYQNLTLSQMSQFFMIAQNCKAITLPQQSISTANNSVFGIIQKINETSQFDFIQLMTPDNNFNYLCASDSFKYYVSLGILYQLNYSTNSYQSIYDIANTQFYHFTSYNKKIILIGYKYEPSIPYLIVSQNIYFLFQKSQSIYPIILDQKIISGHSPYPYIPIYTSKSLSKIVFVYLSLDGKDYSYSYCFGDDGRLIPITIQNHSNFIQIWKSYPSQNYIKIGEDAFLIRNATRFNSNSSAFQQLYVFRDNKFILFGQRQLQTELQINNFSSFGAFSLNNSNLQMSYNVNYFIENGYQIIKTQFSINQTISVPKGYQTSQFNILKTSGNQFVSSDYSIFLSIQKLFNNNYTIFRIYNLNGLTADVSTQIPTDYSFVAGNWQLIVSSPAKSSCNLLFDTDSQTFGFLWINSDPKQSIFYNNITWQNLPSPIRSLTLFQMGQQVVLQQYCSFVYIIDSAETSVYYIYFSVNETKFYDITPPSTYSYKDYYNINFRFLVCDGSIYQGYTDRLTLYKTQIKKDNSSIQYLLKDAEDYEILNYQSRLIVIASNFTSQNKDRTIYFFNNNFQSGLQLFEIKQITDKRIKIKISSSLTKVVMTMTTNITTISILSVDYAALKIIDLYFKKDQVYFSSLQINQYSQVYLGESYLVIRDSGMLHYHSNYKSSQTVYLFVKDKVYRYKSRPLTSNRQVNDFVGIVFDQSRSSNYIYYYAVYLTIDIYYVDLLDFGIFSPTHLDLAHPLFQKISHQDNIQFIARNPFRFVSIAYDDRVAVASTTNVTIIIDKLDRTSATNIKSNVQTIKGSWRYLISNQKCLVLLEQQNKRDISLLTYDSQINQYQTLGNITFTNQSIDVLLASINSWQISDNCDRIAIDSDIYASSSFSKIKFTQILNGYDIYWLTIDQNLTTLWLLDGIRKLNTQNNKYIKIIGYDLTKWLVDIELYLYSYHNRLVFAVGSQNIIQFYAYSQNSNGVYSLSSSYTTIQYFKNQNKPFIKINKQLTTIIFIGVVKEDNSVHYHFDFIYIDYSQHKTYTLKFPAQFVNFKGSLALYLTEKYLYLHQLLYEGNYSAFPCYDLFFHIDNKFQLKLVLKKSIYAQQNSRWIKSYVQDLLSDNDQLTILIEERYSSSLRQRSSSSNTYFRQIKLNKTSIQLCTSQKSWNIINGTFQLCPPGCSSCLYGECTDPLWGYSFDQQTSRIVKCGQFCLTCNEMVPTVCLSCIDGSYLAEQTCNKCINFCKTCISENICLSCLYGYYLENQICRPCSKNCQNCIISGSCLICKRGFVLLQNGECGTCSPNCPSCSPQNINICLSCDDGFGLTNGTCTKCYDNCRNCPNNQCISCMNGYSFQYDSCFYPCKYPCQQCNYTICIKCYYPYKLVNHSCILDVSCNNFSSCTNCGQLSNYYFSNSQCLTCPNISNCIQCLEYDPNLCAVCSDGYFVNSQYICLPCPQECSLCFGPLLCNQCSVGYTLPENTEIGSCLKCESPCLDCSITSTNCTSCLDGYNQIGWKCLSPNKSIGFEIGLNGILTMINSNIHNIARELLKLAKQDEKNLQAIIIFSIKQGSIIVNGSYSPSSEDIISSQSNLAAGLQSTSNILNFNIAYFKVEPKGDAITYQTAIEAESNLGLIVGLSIGLVVLIVIIVIVIVIYKRNKLNQTTKSPGQNVDPRTSAVSMAPSMQFNQDFHKEQESHDKKIYSKQKIVMDKQIFDPKASVGSQQSLEFNYENYKVVSTSKADKK